MAAQADSCEGGSFPEFIHFATAGKRHSTGSLGIASSGDAASHGSVPPPPVSSIPPPPNGGFQTPTKPSRPRRGILKSPSYRLTGRRSSTKSLPEKSALVSTPATVPMTNTSFDNSVSEGDDNESRASSCGSSSTNGTVSTTSTQGLQKAVDRMLCEIAGIDLSPKKSPKKNHKSEPPKDTKEEPSPISSPSSANSIASASTSSTSLSTTSSTSKEELQRCARIKHIENLNERINAAKARKLVERKAYRREDRLLLRLARALKNTHKQSRENELTIKMLEETNRVCEFAYNQSLDELEKLREARGILKERLRAKREDLLAVDREKRGRILRVQKSELEAHKRSHQYYCQELCESVLEADNEVERLRAVWDEHFGEGAARRRKRAWRWAVAALVLIGAVFAAVVGEAIDAASIKDFFAESSMLRTGIPTMMLPDQNLSTLSQAISNGVVLDDNTWIGEHPYFQSSSTTTTKTSTKQDDDEVDTMFLKFSSTGSMRKMDL